MSDDELRFSHLEENSDSDDDEDEVSKKAIFHTDVSPEQKKTKGLRHLKDLKNSLGLDNVKAKSDRRRERKRRAKERRAAAQRGGSGEAGRVETEASKKMGDNRDPVEIVEYIDPRKLRQKKRSDKAIPKVSADQPVLVSMKDARFSVFKFGLSGLAAKEKEDAEVAALVRLGAKPPKKPGVNYKELKETRKLEKEEEKKRKELQRVSGMGSKRKSKKGGKDSEGPPTKKKKRGGESLQTKVGKFNGGMLKLSSKDLAKIKK